MNRDLNSSNGIGSLLTGKARTVAAVAAFSGLALATTVSVQATPAQEGAATDAPLSAVAAATPTTTPQPGDLVSQNGGNHIGIYIGGGKMISALNPAQGTFVHSVNAMPVDGYYTYR